VHSLLYGNPGLGKASSKCACRFSRRHNDSQGPGIVGDVTDAGSVGGVKVSTWVAMAEGGVGQLGGCGAGLV
jgi:hypothetical protein